MPRWALLTATLLAIASPSACRAEPTYGEDVDFLKRHTEVVELTDMSGMVRVAVCPEYQGRVMTSTLAGLEGRSFGWINRPFIMEGRPSKVFNNYGGEDRFWLAPEGGQFSIWFAPGAAQVLANWFTPPALNDGAFQPVATDPTVNKEAQWRGYINLHRDMELTNASKTPFKVGVDRQIELMDRSDVEGQFGTATVQAAIAMGVKFVGVKSGNTITNQGAAWSTESGLLSAWLLGMFKPGRHAVIILPYVPGPESELGPIVNADYFGKLPPERLKVTPRAVLFLGDGQYRSKIGISGRRVRPVIGSYDFDHETLTLVSFSVPEDPAAARYLDNTWNLPQAHPFAGDAVNSYNDGPPEPGATSLGGFYELETLSPGFELGSGASFTHTHATMHFQGPPQALARLAADALGVDLAEVRATMFPQMK